MYRAAAKHVQDREAAYEASHEAGSEQSRRDALPPRVQRQAHRAKPQPGSGHKCEAYRRKRRQVVESPAGVLHYAHESIVSRAQGQRDNRWWRVARHIVEDCDARTAGATTVPADRPPPQRRRSLKLGRAPLMYSRSQPMRPWMNINEGSKTGWTTPALAPGKVSGREDGELRVRSRRTGLSWR